MAAAAATAAPRAMSVVRTKISLPLTFVTLNGRGTPYVTGWGIASDLRNPGVGQLSQTVPSLSPSRYHAYSASRPFR